MGLICNGITGCGLVEQSQIKIVYLQDQEGLFSRDFPQFFQRLYVRTPLNNCFGKNSLAVVPSSYVTRRRGETHEISPGASLFWIMDHSSGTYAKVSVKLKFLAP